MKRPLLRRSMIFQAAAVLCLGIFVYLVFKMDPGRIWSAVRRLGWASWVILMGLRTLFWVFRSVNWYWVMSRYPNRPSLSQAFWARIAGHSVSYLTPASKIGGETVRILMIDGVSKSTVVATAVVDKTIEFMAMLPLIGCSVVLLITRYTLSGPQKSVFLGSLAGAVILLSVFFVLQKKGLLAWIFSALSRLRLRISALERHRGSIEKTDSLISEFYGRNRAVFLGVFSSYVVWALLWVMEIYLSFLFIGDSGVSWLQCYLLVTLGSLAYLLPALPGALGTYEISYLSLFALLSIDLEAGIALILIRRIVGLAWAGVGVAPLLRKGESRIRRSGRPGSPIV